MEKNGHLRRQTWQPSSEVIVGVRQAAMPLGAGAQGGVRQAAMPLGVARPGGEIGRSFSVGGQVYVGLLFMFTKPNLPNNWRYKKNSLAKRFSKLPNDKLFQIDFCKQLEMLLAQRSFQPIRTSLFL